MRKLLPHRLCQLRSVLAWTVVTATLAALALTFAATAAIAAATTAATAIAGDTHRHFYFLDDDLLDGDFDFFHYDPLDRNFHLFDDFLDDDLLHRDLDLFD